MKVIVKITPGALKAYVLITAKWILTLRITFMTLCISRKRISILSCLSLPIHWAGDRICTMPTFSIQVMSMCQWLNCLIRTTVIHTNYHLEQ
jgi:hypothetical protein